MAVHSWRLRRPCVLIGLEGAFRVCAPSRAGPLDSGAGRIEQETKQKYAALQAARRMLLGPRTSPRAKTCPRQRAQCGDESGAAPGLC